MRLVLASSPLTISVSHRLTLYQIATLHHTSLVALVSLKGSGVCLYKFGSPTIHRETYCMCIRMDPVIFLGGGR